MPTSKAPKLYPLFFKKPATQAIEIIDDSDSDEEDDLPLTCLLDSSNKQSPPANKRHSNPKEKKRKKSHTSNTGVAKSKNVFFNERKKPKQTKLSLGSGFDADGNKTSILNATSVVHESPTLMTTKRDLNESARNANNNEGIANGENKDISSKSTINTHEKTVDPRIEGRIYSEASMDFVPQSNLESRAKNSGNIFHKLNRRIYNGGCLFQHPQIRHFSPCSKARIVQNKKSCMPSSFCWPKKWKIPSWISLEQPMTNDNKNIDHVQWDPMGVLLAVAIDRTIIIYDWDMLRAADLQGKRDRVRDCQESEFKIPPIVKFRLPQPVASLVWNPFDMDELAVGFRVSGETRIYNVNRVARWLSRDPSRHNQRLAPQSTYKRVMLQRVTGSVGDILFLDHKNVLVSVGRILFRWQLPLPDKNKGKQQRAPAREGILVWRHQPPSPVTSMAPIGSNLVIIGTNRGHMCLIDWTKRTKVTLSFCHEHRPKVLQSWVPHERLKAPNEDSSLRNKMGIMKLRIETSNHESTVGKRHWGRCRVKWVTQSGWLLSTILDSIRIPDNCLVHYSSPQVVFKNADGSLIDTERKSWSLPYNSIGVDLSDQVPACFVGVPTVTKILSHHDKFVLDSQPSTVVCDQKVLMVHGNDGEIHNIPFPGALKALPQALAVHPSLEWIVLGERKRLHIMLNTARAKVKA